MKDGESWSGARGFLAPDGVAVSFVVSASDNGEIACLQQVGASGPSQGITEVRMAGQKRHSCTQVAGMIAFKPQAAAAARAGVTIARHVSGQQRQTAAQRLQTNLIGAPGSGSIHRR